MHTATVEDVLEQYHVLCDWCDRFYEGVHERLGRHMQCGKGCWFCCTMQSVTPLEAHVIREYLAELEPENLPSSDRDPSSNVCTLVVDEQCFIYPVRPTICRTHGAPMRHGEDGNIGSCKMNFEKLDLDSVDSELVLDEGRAAENLMRLNVAYCKLCGIDDDPDVRVELRQLLDERARQ